MPVLRRFIELQKRATVGRRPSQSLQMIRATRVAQPIYDATSSRVGPSRLAGMGFCRPGFGLGAAHRATSPWISKLRRLSSNRR